MSSDWCSYKKAMGCTETQCEDSHAKMEVEIGGMQPQAKESKDCGNRPKPGRGRGIYLESFWRQPGPAGFSHSEL